MQTALIYGFLTALVAFVLMYLDTRLLDNPKTKTDYLKGMGLVGSIVGIGIILIGEANFEQAVGILDIGGMGRGGVDDDYSGLASNSESIMTGEPNF